MQAAFCLIKNLPPNEATTETLKYAAIGSRKPTTQTASNSTLQEGFKRDKPEHLNL
jgi:hypothetical protein